jgi:hypothetical protein
MLSAQQVKQMLQIITKNSENQNGSVPTVTFSATPASYSVNDLPASILFSGTILASVNTESIVGWAIKFNSSTLNTGTGTTISYTLPGGSVPDELGAFTYTLEVTYLAVGNTTPQTFSTALVINVLEDGKIGYMNSPTGNILVPADVTNAVLTTLSKQDMINVFPITNVGQSRLVIIVPNSFGTVAYISDNTDQVVTSEFNLVNDPSNNRKIYVSVNALAANTYRYIVNFA